MSECLDCGREMHPMDASECLICPLCRMVKGWVEPTDRVATIDSRYGQRVQSAEPENEVYAETGSQVDA